MSFIIAPADLADMTEQELRDLYGRILADLRRAGTSLQECPHIRVSLQNIEAALAGLAQRPQFVRFGADHVPRHDRGRGLAEGAGLHVMGEIGDHRAVHLQVDGDGGTAQLGMGCGAGIGIGKPAEAGDITRQFEDFAVVDVVKH